MEANIERLSSTLAQYLNAAPSAALATNVCNLYSNEKERKSFDAALQMFGRFTEEQRARIFDLVGSIKNEQLSSQKTINHTGRPSKDDALLRPSAQNERRKRKLEDRECPVHQIQPTQFKIPDSRSDRFPRQRRLETPSFGEGLSDAAREKLYQHRLQKQQLSAKENTITLSSSHRSTPMYSNGSRTPSVRGRELSTPRSSSWRERTPMVTSFENAIEYPEEQGSRHVYDDMTMAYDRQFYTAEEGAIDEGYNPFNTTREEDTMKEAQLVKQQRKRISAYAAARKVDSDLWEDKQLRHSGITKQGSVDLDFEEDNENRVHLLVHDLRPPFLDGQQQFTLRKDNVSAVLDPQSDLAVISRKGSAIVKERRERKEREKAAASAASIEGTTLGNLTGASRSVEDEANVLEPKQDSKFAQHLKQSDAVSHFSRSKTLLEQRQSLPAFAVKEDLIGTIRDNQVVVCIGETGSGKTTQLTQFLKEAGYSTYGLIGCTQPRRVAAMSVAKRVSEEMLVELGQEVGYAIRFEDCTSRTTEIKYMTDGVLLRESLVEADLGKYSCIIMDEAHERALNTDILMGLLRKILIRRRDLRLIVTSATMNADRFSSFFGGAPQFTIPGRTFPVDVLYAKSPCEDYVEAAIKQVLNIHLSQPAGDILVFMTGQEDIEVTCETIGERLSLLDSPPKLSILPIYSSMPADLQTKIFDAAEVGVRKVIVATNIAETSLTVDGIMYVVDCGFSKLKVYNPGLQMDTLQITPISQANANQRSGRAGRTGPGTAYRLYTEAAYRNEMYPQTIPEIQRTNLANTVLLLKSLGVKNLLDFDFMDAPPQDTMLSSLFDLWSLGALSNSGDLTELGLRMSAFPMEPSMSKLIIMAESYNCLEEVLTIVSILSVPSIFYRPKERAEEADSLREKFAVPESDHLTLLYIYQQWKAHNYSDGWCTKHFLHAKALRRAREIRLQLADICQKQKMRNSSAGSDWDIIRKCICSGYFHQSSRLRGVAEFSNLRSGMTASIHPTSALYGLGYLPEYVVYHQVMLTSKTYMSVVTAVDPYWLAELGGVFFSIKEKGYGVSKRQTESSMNRKMELEMEFAREKAKREALEAEEREKQRRLTSEHITRLATPGQKSLVSRIKTPASAILRPGSSVVRPTPRGTPRR